MKEIEKRFYLEESCDDVVVGTVKLDQGLLFNDSPLQLSDQAAWWEEVEKLGEGKDQITLMLDTHINREIGMRVEDCRIPGHKLAAKNLKNRPTSLRLQEVDAGAEVEILDQPINARWPMPDMTFSNTIAFCADENSLTITHRPGCHLAGYWVRSDAEKTIFVGDSVIAHQPLFLALADMELCLAELSALQTVTFKFFKFVSSRNGLIDPKAIEKLIDFLSYVKVSLADLAFQEDVKEAIADLLLGCSERSNLISLLPACIENAWLLA